MSPGRIHQQQYQQQRQPPYQHPKQHSWVYTYTYTRIHEQVYTPLHLNSHHFIEHLRFGANTKREVIMESLPWQMEHVFTSTLQTSNKNQILLRQKEEIEFVNAVDPNDKKVEYWMGEIQDAMFWF